MTADDRTARKATAVSFMRLSASGKAREAFRIHGGAGFRHHNPFFGSDAETLMAAMDENAAQNPDKILEIQRALADGDLVAVHARVQLKRGDPEVAVVHIYRFQGDAIVELWDVAQPAPKEQVNENGMF